MTSLIKPGEAWQLVRGFRHGLQQQSVAGTVDVDAHAAAGLPRLESFLRDFVGEPLPPGVPHERAGERVLGLLAFVHGAIQREARIAVSDVFYMKARRTPPGRDASYDLYLPAPSLDACKIAFTWARFVCDRMLRPASDEQVQALLASREQVLNRLQRYSSSGVNTFCILLAAYRLRVPVYVFDKTVLQLGTGRYSRWMESSITDATSWIGVALAARKHHAARVLLAAGLPGGVHRLAASADAAVEAAASLGFPVVVKPADKERGEGVSADLRTEEAVRAAWELARKASPEVLVERHQPGFTHRITVYNGQVIRVSRRRAGGVMGDGTRTVAELVALVQDTDRHRSALRRDGAPRLTLDDEAHGLLEQEGIDASHVPAAGAYVRLRRRDNMSAGGTNEPVSLDQVHPDNLELARDAARLLRLDFAGIDLIMNDIESSWLDTGALICEVNAQPQMAARSEPALWDRVVSELVGPCSRVPARLLIVPEDAARERAVAERIAHEEPATSVSSRAGLWIAGRLATMPFATGFRAAQALLQRTDVQAAACLMTLGELERAGLPLDQWDRIDVVDSPEPGSDDAKRLERVMPMARAHLHSGEAEGVS